MLLFVLETVVPGVHFLWFGVAAVIVGALAMAVPHGLAIADRAVFADLGAHRVSGATLGLRRRHARTDEPDLNIRGAQYIGRFVIVEEAIRNGRGKVRVGDTIWGAEGEDAPRARTSRSPASTARCWSSPIPKGNRKRLPA